MKLLQRHADPISSWTDAEPSRQVRYLSVAIKASGRRMPVAIETNPEERGRVLKFGRMPGEGPAG